MPPNKSGDQVLQDCHDDAADALRVISTGGGTPPTTTPERQVKAADTSAPWTFTTGAAGKWRPQTIVVKAAAPVTGDLTLRLRSKSAGNPEYLLGTVLTGWTEAYFELPGPLWDNGDEVKLDTVNTGGISIEAEALGEQVS